LKKYVVWVFNEFKKVKVRSLFSLLKATPRGLSKRICFFTVNSEKKEAPLKKDTFVFLKTFYKNFKLRKERSLKRKQKRSLI
jgi:hypothetical protein